jgi:Holliday junction DNA helicase RuvB
VEEILYPAMEDHALDLIIGEGPSARSVKIELPPFTLVGATTRAGLLSTPLRDRFGIPVRLDFYTREELGVIVARAGRKIGADISQDGAEEIAGRSRGTPRIAVRLLRRVRDFCEAEGKAINRISAGRALARLEVDADGLDALDRRYLSALVQTYAGGPVGADTLAAALSEARDSIEEVIEPYLMQQGLVARTPRGRIATPRAWERVGLKPPASLQPQLFEDPQDSPGDSAERADDGA